MTKVTTTHQIGDAAIKAKSDIDEGQRLDTEIEIGDTYLCSVAGADVMRFLGELEQLVEKYRI